MEWNGLQRSLSAHRRWNEHDITDGFAISNTRLCVILWIGRSFGGRYVIGRFIGSVGRFNVCPQCLSPDFPSKCIRNGNHLGYANRHLRCRRAGHRHGINNPINLRTLVNRVRKKTNSFSFAAQYINYLISNWFFSCLLSHSISATIQVYVLWFSLLHPFPTGKYNELFIRKSFRFVALFSFLPDLNTQSNEKSFFCES